MINFSDSEHFNLETTANNLLLKLPAWDSIIEHGFFIGPPDLKNQSVFTSVDHLSQIFSDSKLELLNQVHGNKIVSLDQKFPLEQQLQVDREADGWFYRGDIGGLGFSLGILTADCTPVLIRSTTCSEVALLHCGWQGTKLGLLPMALSMFSDPESCQIAIGPAANICCYEVGEGFAMQHFSDFVDSQDVLKNNHLSIPKILALQAAQSRVSDSQIFSCDVCTICNQESYSFRRQAALAGRQLSFISI